VKLFGERKCPLDDFEMLAVTSGARGKSFPFCPYCFNHPPFKDMRKGSGCNMCSHPTCPQSMIVNGVCACPDCERGILVLDPSSGPKWKLACNRYVHEDIALFVSVVVLVLITITKIVLEFGVKINSTCQFILLPEL
jgi:hypothetical protein